MTLTIDDLKTEHSFQGTWITDKTIPYDRKKSPVPLCVRKTFTLKKKLRRAMLYATAVGSYYVTVNGEKITAEMLAPGYCQRQAENVDFRRNRMSFFGGQHSSVYSPYTPLHLPA